MHSDNYPNKPSEQQTQPQSHYSLPPQPLGFYKSSSIDTIQMEETVKRTLCDHLDEVQKNLSRLDNINAMPLKTKITEWHFNVWPHKGAYASYGCLHGILEFPRDYPISPPTIQLACEIKHPSITTINNKHWVSINICSQSNWKPSYTVLNILQELSRVFDENTIKDSDLQGLANRRNKILNYACMWCGHNRQQPFPDKKQYYAYKEKDIHILKADNPLPVYNPDYAWKYCRIKQIVANFSRVYYEAEVISTSLEPNNLSSIQIGWALLNDEDEHFEHIVLGNRYKANSIHSVLIHKSPYKVNLNQEIEYGFTQGDVLCCAVDFETKPNPLVQFFINGRPAINMIIPNSFFDEYDGTPKPLVPVVGLSASCVQLNFRQSKYPIDTLNNFFTVKEYLTLDRGDYLWANCNNCDWNQLFVYGLPPDPSVPIEEGVDKINQLVLEIFHYLPRRDLHTCQSVCHIWESIIQKSHVIYHSKLRCYVTQKSFDEKDVIIGLLLRLQLANENKETITADTNNNKKTQEKGKDSKKKQHLKQKKQRTIK